MTEWTLGREPNSYYLGSDAPLYKDGERVALVGIRDNRPAVCVKDRNLYAPPPEGVGEQEAETLYEGFQEAFWRATEEFVAPEYGYTGVYQEGRSGGWLVPEPEADLDSREGRVRFYRFAERITELVDETRADYVRELAEQAKDESHIVRGQS